MKSIILYGNPVVSGCYLLRLAVGTPMAVQFGRFQVGKMIDVPAGTYLYIGSALGKKGSSTLAHRLLRHTTRQHGVPHAIRPLLLEQIHNSGLGSNKIQVPQRKTLFWHIDYLLEETAVDLTHIIILRTNMSMENKLARLLAADPQTSPLINGLGASDDPGQTHLLCVPESLTWWRNLADLMASTDILNP